MTPDHSNDPARSDHPKNKPPPPPDSSDTLTPAGTPVSSSEKIEEPGSPLADESAPKLPQEPSRAEIDDVARSAALSVHFPPEVNLPLDQEGFGTLLFYRSCLASGAHVVAEQEVRKLDTRYARVIHANYQDIAGSPDFFAHVRVRVKQASVGVDGCTALLVTFTDTETGNYLLPRRRIRLDEDGKPYAECKFDGGSPYFQAMVFTFLGKSSSEDGDTVRLRFKADYFVPEVTLLPELSRLAHADWRSPLAGELEDFLWMHKECLECVQTVRAAEDVSSAFATLLLCSEKDVFLVGIGDWNGDSIIRAEFGVRFMKPLQNGASPESSTPRVKGAPAVQPSEQMLSAIRERALSDGDLIVAENDLDARFDIPKLEFALTDRFVRRLPKGAWESDWKLRIQVSSLSPEGALNAVAVIESSDGHYVLPWLSDEIVPLVLRSDRFMGVSVRVTVPAKTNEPPLRDESEMSRRTSERVDGAILTAHIPSALMESEISLLSDRARVGSGFDSPAEQPSARAKESIFYGPLRQVIIKDLIARGHLTSAQADGLSLSDIRVAREEADPLDRLHGAEIYLVHVMHQLGAHVVRFARLKEIGIVPFDGFGEVVGFFPETLTTRRDLPPGAFDLH
jgi:hypothetical protein